MVIRVLKSLRIRYLWVSLGYMINCRSACGAAAISHYGGVSVEAFICHSNELRVDFYPLIELNGGDIIDG